MPFAAPSRCAENGCHKLATYKGRCDDHQRKPWANVSAHGRALTRQESAIFRRDVLRRDPICRACGAAPSTDADHITPIALGGSPRDIENGQGLCAPCHALKTRIEAAQRREAQRRAAEGVRESPSVGAPHASTPTVSLCTPPGVSRQKVEGDQ